MGRKRGKRAERSGARRHLSAQRTFGFKRRDGHRAGRPRKPGAKLRHAKREEFAARFPVHVVLKLEGGLPTLRARRPYRVLRGAFREGRDRFGFRLNHYSVQGNHLHLIVEAQGRRSLSKGVGALKIRIARGLNRLWERRGRVFADRYYDHILRTPLEVKRALAYVLKNHRRHLRGHGLARASAVDAFSSGMWFGGWKEVDPSPMPAGSSGEFSGKSPVVARARTWLQRVGWRRHGLISVRAT